MIIKILEDTPNSGHEKEHLTLLLSNIQEKIQELGLPRGSLAIGVGNDIKFANYINHDCLYYQSFNHMGTSMHIQYIALGFRGTRLNFSKKTIFLYLYKNFSESVTSKCESEIFKSVDYFYSKEKISEATKNGVSFIVHT